MIVTWRAPHRLAICAALVLIVLARGVVAASAASAPPYTDSASQGGLTFYDAQGRAIIGGSSAVSVSSEIARVVGAGPAAEGYRDAGQLYLWVPTDGSDPSSWNGAPLSRSQPLASPVNGPETLTRLSDFSMESKLPEALGPSTGAVAGLYELRLISIQPGPQVAPRYYTADIRIDQRAHTWRVVRSGTTTDVKGAVLTPSPEVVKSAIAAQATTIASLQAQVTGTSASVSPGGAPAGERAPSSLTPSGGSTSAGAGPPAGTSATAPAADPAASTPDASINPATAAAVDSAPGHSHRTVVIVVIVVLAVIALMASLLFGRARFRRPRT